jgi:hypothetical protein
MFHLPDAEIRAVLAPAGMWFVNRELDLDHTHALKSDFPDIAQVRVKEFLDSSWARDAAAAPSAVKM